MSSPTAPEGGSHSILKIPELCLVLLVGPAGSGKSTFAREHFRSTETLSTDYFRGMVSDDETNQGASPDAFEVVQLLASKRLARGRLTVIDATNLKADARKPYYALAKSHHVQTIAIAFALPLQVCLEFNGKRENCLVPIQIIEEQHGRLSSALANLEREPVHEIHVLSTIQELDAVEIMRTPLSVNRRFDRGPFDIIGDVHGCFTELCKLLTKLGYLVAETSGSHSGRQFQVHPPVGRKVVFVGDLVDRGPGIAEVLQLVMGMAEQGVALSVIGNHDDKLLRKLSGKNLNISHGLAQTLAQLEKGPSSFRERVFTFFKKLPHHLVLDRGRLVVAHAGLKWEMQGRDSGEARSFALFGDTTGERDEYGLPVRRDWAAQYRGKAVVVYGHTPVLEAQWHNNTINIDTGCVFGNRLTALRYPELELVAVPAEQVYCEPSKPLLPPRQADFS